MQVVFITYLNRSGSTFLVNQLSKHPNVLVMPEGEILVTKLLRNPRSIPHKNILKILSIDTKIKHWVWNIPDSLEADLPSTNAELFFYLINKYREKNAPDAEIVVFKAWELIDTVGRMPSGLMADYRVKYFGLIRDLRAVAASQRSTYYKNRPLENNTLRTIIKWKRFIRVCKANKLHIKTLQYEKMITEYRLFFNNLFKELGLTWEQKMEQIPGRVTASLPQDQKLLHSNIDLNPKEELIDYWKNNLSPADIEIIQKLSKKELTRLGYTLVPVKSSWIRSHLTIAKYLAGYPFAKVFKLLH